MCNVKSHYHGPHHRRKASGVKHGAAEERVATFGVPGPAMVVVHSPAARDTILSNDWQSA